MEIDRCPRCGMPGSVQPKKVRSKGHTYLKWYVVHSGKHVGKTHHTRWCYLTDKTAKDLGVAVPVMKDEPSGGSRGQSARGRVR